MTITSLKSVFRVPKRHPKPWVIAATLTAVRAAGLIVADLEIAQLQSERADVQHRVAEQSLELTDAEAGNAELGEQIDAVREVIAEQETLLSSTTGLLP